MKKISTRKKILKQTFAIMEANERFLFRNARGVYDEVIELVNDSIDYLRLISRENYQNNAMTFFYAHVLMPQSSAMYLDLLSGNLPICFAELRLMVESLAKSFYLDRKYQGNIFFQHKFQELGKISKLSITRIVKEAGMVVKVESEFTHLWKRLSRDWIHAEGLVDRVVDSIAHRKAPPWGIVIPMKYCNSDLKELHELRHNIESFRKITGRIAYYIS